jgi:N-acetylneuraminic acid mutarotase
MKHHLLVALAGTLAAVSGACDGSSGESSVDAPISRPDGGTAGQGRWETLAAMPERPRFYVGVAAARGQVFVVGGFNEGDDRAVNAFDTTAGSWATLPPLPVAFQMPNVAAVGPAGAERLLVLGGLRTSMTFEYDFASRSWKPLAPATRGRGGAAVGVHGTRVLLAGGAVPGQSANMLNTGKRVSDALAYDAATDSWSPLPELPAANGYAVGAVIGNEFWMIGGSTDFARTDQVLALNLATGTAWETRPPMPRSTSSAAGAVLRGKVYLTGGIATSTGMIGPDCLVLDPATGLWSTVAPITTPRFGTGAAVVGDRMYVPTGMATNPTNPDAFQATPAMEVYIP